ncbi:MAG: zinc ribbon domain-containing protein [Nitrospirae bacterium]|nr:zinc ribbon domain-containing protein [Nitrospirota bacterium]
MVLDLRCPTCASDYTQRLSMMRGLQGLTDSAGQTALVAPLKAPAKPWGFLLGFVLGLLLTVLIVTQNGWSRSPLLVVIFFTAWIGTGVLVIWPYRRKLREWQQYLDAHFICHRCGAIFQPGKPTKQGLTLRKVCIVQRCGKQIPQEAKTCPYCGQAQVPRVAKA